jgi:formate hydrogenlyase subunit 4
MVIMTRFIPPVAALVLAPLLVGVINRTKASFAGRKGRPLLQLYFDLWRLLHKGAVYSSATTWIFKAGPIVGLAAVAAASLIMPLGSLPAPLEFGGDLIFMFSLLGLMRFMTMLSAMDTGSSFEGMGASREAQFGALAEPALLLGLAAVARMTHTWSLGAILPAVTPGLWLQNSAALCLVLLGLLVVLLAENARIPIDDPNTHLELTMVHEVMVLDHSGVDLAFIEYSAAVKLWLMGSLVVGLALPCHGAGGWREFGAMACGMALLGVLIGVIESTLARLKLVHVPMLLVGASVFTLVGLLLG